VRISDYSIGTGMLETCIIAVAPIFERSLFNPTNIT
jgi:hypothetical protein